MKCWICENEASKTFATDTFNDSGYWEYKKPSKFVRCYCDKCYEEVKERNKADEEEYIRLKKKQMFNSAMANLETQNVDMYKLRPAIDKVEEYIINNPDKFDSSYEIIAAIVLINAGIKFQLQKKILRYQVDIYIPSHKIIVEIDGERHKNRKTYDKERDERIIDEVGYEWNIIRIPTEHLDKNAIKLVKAIDHVMKYRSTGKVNWREI